MTVQPDVGSHNGDLILRRIGHRLHIVSADEFIKVSPELLEQIKSDNHHIDVSRDGDLLTINGVARTVVYRLGAEMVDKHGARWFAADMQCPALV